MVGYSVDVMAEMMAALMVEKMADLLAVWTVVR